MVVELNSNSLDWVVKNSSNWLEAEENFNRLVSNKEQVYFCVEVF